MRDVACLFVTSNNKVLIASKDSVHWTFPQEEIPRNEGNRLTETPQTTIQRVLCEKFDINSQEEDTYLEMKKEFLSHRGEETMYHIFTTDPTNLRDVAQKSNGTKFVWTEKPHSYNLNACARDTLHLYGYFE